MPQTAKITDFSDREFLWFIHEASDENGWASTADITERIGLDAKYPHSNVGIRCSYMKRIGMLKREKKTGYWQLTDRGDALRIGKLRQGVASALEAIPTETLNEVMLLVGRRMNANEFTRTAVRREYTYADARFRRNGRRR